MNSINPLNGKIYEIPNVLDDSDGIDNFLRLNNNKKVIVVQGLGFVGSVMSLVCANSISEDYAVIGLDLPTANSYWKIQSINEGEFPIVASDPNIQKFYHQSLQKGNFYATYDTYCLKKADVIIVDINLDVIKKSDFEKKLESFDVNLDGFKDAIDVIGKNCKCDVLILVETTVPPGTCLYVVKPIIDKKFSERGLPQDYKLGHSYERVMPGPDYIDSIQNFYRVYSGIDKKSADSTEKFLKTIISTDKYPLTRLGNTTATEMAKVLENSYRAMNIAFMVEWSRFAEEAGVNLFEVVHAIRMRPTHSNMMYPGIGVGGYCLTKDPLLASWSKKNIFSADIGLPQSEIGVVINDQMPLFAFNLFLKENNFELKNKKILILGISYRSNVGDTRFSPVEYFYNYLEHAQAEIHIQDPYVKYWEEKKIDVEQNLDIHFSKEWDSIIICTGHEDYRAQNYLFKKIIEIKSCFIFDSIGFFSNSELNSLSSKHKIRVLGRGDIK
jgi:UDP-N-acetyl-D-glucosamine dehydrogenase